MARAVDARLDPDDPNVVGAVAAGDLHGASRRARMARCRPRASRRILRVEAERDIRFLVTLRPEALERQLEALAHAGSLDDGLPHLRACCADRVRRGRRLGRVG